MKNIKLFEEFINEKSTIYDGKMDASQGHNFRINDTSMIIVGDDEKEFQI